MEPESEHLLDRVRNKDPEALAEFIEKNRARLTAFIERQLSDTLRRKVEADDILQETTVYAMRGLNEIDLNQRNLFSWLCQVAERRIIDAYRRFFGAQKRNAAREVPLGTPSRDAKPSLIELLINSTTTPSQAFSRNARELKLITAMNTLSEDQQEALRMRYVDGLPSKEIAKRLGKTDGSVRVMLTRSLKRLQSLLADEV